MLFGKEQISPGWQGTGIFCAALACILILNTVYAYTEPQWTVLFTGLLFYAAANPLMGLFRKKWGKYLWQSFAVFILLLAGLTSITGLLTHESPFANYSHEMTLIVITIFYIGINLLGIFYRLLVSWVSGLDQHKN